MPRTGLAYRGLVELAAGLAPLAATRDPKLRAALAARRGVLDRLAAWGAAHRDPARPLSWFHAPSVGEGLQARAVLEAFRARQPGWQVAWTWFSPSAERLAASVGADVHDCLPLDRARDVRAALDALRPDLLVFTKLDLWPELATQAAARGIPVALVAATVRPGSGRLGAVARALLHPGYEAVTAAGAIAEEDAARLARLGVPRDRIRVTGDPRMDSVAARVAAVPPDDPLLRLGHGAPTLVAGSTWPPDEDALLDAFGRIRAHRPDARLILVPHEPTPAALDRIGRQAALLGLPAPVRLTEATGPVPLLVVDRTGVLAALYGAGRLAYVGGGFGHAGLHSVLEPAAWGLPVLFGPRWQESRDAELLVRAGAAEPLAELGQGDARDQLARTWEAWIANERRRAAQGARARQVVEQGLGAADRSAALLEGLRAPGPR